MGQNFGGSYGDLRGGQYDNGQTALTAMTRGRRGVALPGILKGTKLQGGVAFKGIYAHRFIRIAQCWAE